MQKMSLKFDISERGIKKAFSSCDKDGNGLLGLHEMVDAVQIYLNGIPRKDVKCLIKCYDVNKDGYISFEEFYQMITTGCATRPNPSDHQRNRENKISLNRNNIINNLDPENLDVERGRVLQERRRNREMDEAVSILSQARVLEQMVADMETGIKERERQRELDDKYKEFCEQSLRSRKDAGKPLYPIYSAVGFKEPDLMPARNNSANKRSQATSSILAGSANETNLRGSRPSRTGGRPRSAARDVPPAESRSDSRRYY